jgi:hypothetical protein
MIPTFNSFNISVIVCSSDGYSDLWPIFFKAWFENSPFRECKIYLVSEELNYDDARVKTINIPNFGVNNWSTRLNEALNIVTSEYILLLTDDLIFVKNSQILSIADLLQKLNLQSFDVARLVPRPPPPRHIFSKKLFTLLPNWAMHRVSLQPTLWRSDVLRQITIPGETPWKFELNGSKRSCVFHYFYCATRNMVEYVEVVAGGKVTRAGVRAIASIHGLHFLTRNRTTFSEEVYRTYSLVKSKILYLMPISFQKFLITRKIIGRDSRDR